MVVAMSLLPPQFTLLSHSNLASSSSVTAANPTASLAHPSIQYHFRDDPPISLPHPQNKHVLIMDYDPRAPQSIRVQSLSSQLAVTSVKITDAPGAGPYGENDEPRNNKMYVIETVAHQIPDERSATDDVHSVSSLTGFRQRNALLRKALHYPLPSARLQTSATVSPRPSPSQCPSVLPPMSPTA